MNRALAAVLLLLCSRSAGATDLAVTDVAIARVPNTPTAYVTLNVAWPLDLTVDLSLIRDLSAETALEGRVFGIEMVEIPEGAFMLGDPDRPH